MLAPQRFDDDRAEDRSSELLDRRLLSELPVADATSEAFGEVLLDPEAVAEVRSDSGVLRRRGDERAQKSASLGRLEDRQHAAQPGLDIGGEVSGVGNDEVDGDEPTFREAFADEGSA